MTICDSAANSHGQTAQQDKLQYIIIIIRDKEKKKKKKLVRKGTILQSNAYDRQHNVVYSAKSEGTNEETDRRSE